MQCPHSYLYVSDGSSSRFDSKNVEAMDVWQHTSFHALFAAPNKEIRRSDFNTLYRQLIHFKLKICQSEQRPGGCVNVQGLNVQGLRKRRASGPSLSTLSQALGRIRRRYEVSRRRTMLGAFRVFARFCHFWDVVVLPLSLGSERVGTVFMWATQLRVSWQKCLFCRKDRKHAIRHSLFSHPSLRT